MDSLFYVSYAAMWVLLIVIATLVLLLYRHFGLVALGTADGIQRDGLPVGEKPPSIIGVGARGERLEWSPLSGPKLLIFGAPGCEPCARILPAAELLKRTTQLDVTVVVSGSREAAAAIAQKFPSSLRCIADDGSDAFGRFRVRVSPFGFVLGPDGLIRSKGLISDAYRLRDLMSTGGLRHLVPALSTFAAQQTAVTKEEERPLELLVR